MIDAIGRIGPPASAVTETLLSLVNRASGDERTSSIAIEALVRIAPDNEAVVQALLEFVRTARFWLHRQRGVRLLPKIGVAARDAIDCLIEAALSNEMDFDVCCIAAETLGDLGAEAQAAVPALAEAIKEPLVVELIRQRIFTAFLKIASREQVLDTLVEAAAICGHNCGHAGGHLAKVRVPGFATSGIPKGRRK